jgi:3',5'-nucleoside bisphosphate phosphatase
VAARHTRRPTPPTDADASTVDLHTHTLRSDGVLQPVALVGAVAAAGIRTLAITDHDTLAAYRELVDDRAVPASIELIAGVEINALAKGIRLADGELHILGFGMDPGDDAFEAALAKQRSARKVRFERTVALLREVGMPIDAHLAHIDLTRDDALGRPTIARALIAGGYAKSVEDAFNRLIGWGGPGYVQREGMGPREAIEAIAAAGGIPVLAHFSEAPGQMPLLRELTALGLAGLEVYYISFPPETVTMVGAVAKTLRLLATCGSDYHGDTSTYAEAHAAIHVPSAVGDGLRAAIAAVGSPDTMPER